MDEENKAHGLELQTCLFCNKYFDKKPELELTSSSGEVAGFESAFKLFCEFISRDNNELLKYKSDNCWVKVGRVCCSECHFNLLELERCERIIKETKLTQENILKTLKDALLHPKPLFSFTLQSSRDSCWIFLRETLIKEIKKNDFEEEIIDCGGDNSDDFNDFGHETEEEKDLLGFTDEFPSPLAPENIAETNLPTQSDLNGSSSPPSSSVTKACYVSLKRISLDDFPNLKPPLKQLLKPSKKQFCSNLQNKSGKRKMRGRDRARNGLVFYLISESHKLLLFQRTPIRYSNTEFQCLEINCSHKVAGTDYDAFTSMKTHILSTHPILFDYESELRPCPICKEGFRTGYHLQKHLFSEHVHPKRLKNSQRVICESCWKEIGYGKHPTHTWTHKNEEEKKTELQSGRTLPFELRDQLQKKGELQKVVVLEESNDVKQQNELGSPLPEELRRLLIRKKFKPRRKRVIPRHPPKQCNICQKILSDHSSWAYHIKTHKSRESREKFLCPECGAQFISSRCLASHKKRYHGGLEASKLKTQDAPPIKKNRAEKMLLFHLISEKDKLLLLERTPIRYSPSGFHCLDEECSHEVSGTDFEAFTSIKSHILTNHHFGSQPRTCPICPEKLQSRVHLRKHLFEMHVRPKTVPTHQKVVCEVCWKVVMYRNHPVHIWTHKNEEEKAAEIQNGKTLPYEIRVKLKINESEKPELQKMVPIEKRKNRKIEEIDKEASEAGKTGKKYYPRPEQCKICLKTLSSHCAWLSHMKTHENWEDRKKFQCPDCGNFFLSERALIFHQDRIHNSEPAKLECHICQRQFFHRDVSKFNEHLRKHAGETPWICEECGEGFTANSALTKHKKIRHSGGNQFQCDLCEKSYMHSKGLIKHQRKVHPEVATKKGERCGRGGAGRRFVN